MPTLDQKINKLRLKIKKEEKEISLNANHDRRSLQKFKSELLTLYRTYYKQTKKERQENRLPIIDSINDN